MYRSENEIKQQNRHREGTIRFFYGSIDSRLWRRYVQHIDETINIPPNAAEIVTSLTEKGIAITDLIVSCERIGYSSEDSKLRKRVWNRIQIQDLIHGGITKILCTSKGVLSDLETKVISPAFNSFGEVNQEESEQFQENFLHRIGGNLRPIDRPIVRVFDVFDGSRVTVLAIPSPGSPQRQLARFGFSGNNWSEYAERYFEAAFNWLQND